MASKDIGGGNNDYATPALWASYLDALNTLTEEEVGNLFDKGSAYTSQVTFTGFTATSTNRARLTVPSGDSFCDATDGTALAYDAANGAAIEVTGGNSSIVVGVSHTVIERVQIKHINSGYQRSAVEFQSGVSGAVIRDCIATNNDDNHVINLREGTAANCLAVAAGNGSTNRGIQIVSGGSIINCTAVKTGTGTAIGIAVLYGGHVRNTLCMGFATPFSGTWTSADHNGSDGTTPGTNATSSLVLADTFESATTDFRLKSGSGAINKASRDASYTTDIRGTLRDSGANLSDLGCIEFVSAGGGTTINAGPAHLGLTGRTATASAATNIAAGRAQLGLTGRTATASASTVIAAGHAQLPLTGRSASVNGATTISAGPAHLGLTGRAASASTQTTIQAGAAHLGLTGRAATAQAATQQTVIEAGAARLGISGSRAQVSSPRTIAARDQSEPTYFSGACARSRPSMSTSNV